MHRLARRQFLRWVPATAAGLATVWGADDKKKLVLSDPTAGNDRIDITASLLLDPEELRKALGGVDVPKGTIAVKARVKPVDSAIRIDFDDFQIVSHKDGHRATAYAPSQLAGGPALMIKTETTSVGTGPMTRNTGPTWGGVPGTMGRPQQLPGSGSVVGNGGSAAAQANTGVETRDGGSSAAAGKGEDPVLRALKDKAVPVGEIKEPVSGLLYFALEGKHKAKDLTLIYKGPYGRLVLSFGK